MNTIDADGWTRVCPLPELRPGKHVVVDVDGAEAAVFNIDGDILAIEDLCTHDGAPLSGGPVVGCEIICPRHGSRFCLKTGEALSPPAYEPTAVFPVRIEDGVIYVRDDRWD